MANGVQQVSENSRRIARNTVLLYFRMLLLLFVGLFTSRIVLQALGKPDYGTYNVVAGLVTMFTVFTNSVTTAISRFITRELGRGDTERLKRVFSTSVIIQTGLCLLIFILVETAGVWFLNAKMNIPSDRMTAANWVLQCAMIQLMAVLVSAPYNAVIMAHEQMKTYAGISILEALLKLSVALLLLVSGFDKLITYAVLMVAVSIIIRFTYGASCRRRYEETRGKLVFDSALVREMTGFAGWNALASAVYMFNTQGMNILTNSFFGVLLNAARGVAFQVEAIVKQFVFNVINALNPQITKSFVCGSREYSWALVSKGAKYACLIVLFFLIPSIFEVDTILHLWLTDVPEYASLFTVLGLTGLLLDVIMSTGSTIVLADGRIRGFYLAISAVTVFAFPAVWILFRMGAPAYSAYLVFIAIYIVNDVVKLVMIHRITDYPYEEFFKEVVFRVLGPAAICVLFCWLVTIIIPNPVWWRALVTVAVSSIALLVSCWFLAFTPGERSVLLSRLK